MRQVRIGKSEIVRKYQRDKLGNSLWELKTPKSVDILNLAVNAGNAKFGAGSHWIEDRYIDESGRDPDNEIWALIQMSMQAWLDGANDHHASFYTAEANFIAPDGNCFRGRQDIIKAFDELAKRFPQRVMEVQSCQITYLDSYAAVVMMQGLISHGKAVGSKKWASIQTVKNTIDGWLIAAHQAFYSE